MAAAGAVAAGPGLPPRFIACVALSLSLHLSLLEMTETQPAQRSAPGGTQRVVHARVLPATVAPKATVEASAGQNSRSADTRKPAVPNTAEPTASDEPGLRTPQSEPIPDESKDGEYLPRAALTEGPRPRNPILIPYPAFQGDQGRYSVELSLFIDAEGLVRRVDLAPGALPPVLEAVVRETFMGTPFEPGQVDGQPVRSQMRIEVSFDSGASRR